MAWRHEDESLDLPVLSGTSQECAERCRRHLQVRSLRSADGQVVEPQAGRRQMNMLLYTLRERAASPELAAKEEIGQKVSGPCKPKCASACWTKSEPSIISVRLTIEKIQLVSRRLWRKGRLAVKKRL